MKNLFILCLLALLPLTYACKSDASSEATDTTTPAGSTAVQPAAPAAAPAPATASTGGVQHYICPKNCQGSGGPAQGNCPVCGTAYVHNQAFHDQPAQQPGAAPAPAMSPAGPTATPPQPAAEPAQNAAGVWHYTCSKGCAGGAGSAVACGKCGTLLVHNTAYHN